jgi:nitroreductase
MNTVSPHDSAQVMQTISDDEIPVFQSLLSRQSHWPLTEPGPDDGELSVIFDVALRAPDHGRLRPWRFVLVRDAARETLGQVLVDAASAREPNEPPETYEHRRQRATAAPVVIAIGAAIASESHIPEVEQLLSVGAATMNMLNAIHALGYGGFWATGPDAYDSTLQQALGFDEADRLLGFLFIGTPASPSRRISRPDRSAHVREWLGVAS